MTKFYGLTGGIGSGKSTVASIFASMGIPTLDLDQLGKEIIQQDPQILKELVRAFGASVLNKQGILDNAAIANIAFSTSENTQILNDIMHPRIQQAEMEWRRNQTAPIAVIEASVIIESGAVGRMDALIVVMSDMDIREKRVISRGKQNLKAFQQIVARQCTDEARLAYADHIIENNASLAVLQSSAVKLLHTLSY